MESKEKLEELYFKENLSIRDIAKRYNVSDMTIRRWAKNYGFKFRNMRDACKLRCKLKPHTNPGRKGMPKRGLMGKDNPAWKGGFIRKDGYKVISVDGEQRLEHRYIWEQYHKKPIPQGHQVHHINGKKADNRIENLKVVSNSEHQKLHNQARNKEGKFSTQ